VISLLNTLFTTFDRLRSPARRSRPSATPPRGPGCRAADHAHAAADLALAMRREMSY
jgi:hypothetical protein